MATRYAELVGRLNKFGEHLLPAAEEYSDELTTLSQAAAAITALEAVADASRTYFDRYVENCVCGDQQHLDAIALRDALASIESKP